MIGLFKIVQRFHIFMENISVCRNAAWIKQKEAKNHCRLAEKKKGSRASYFLNRSELGFYPVVLLRYLDICRYISTSSMSSSTFNIVKLHESLVNTHLQRVRSESYDARMRI
ncbi:hypothetical protein LOAG_09714 [Loa loa]|uniref:Uncharacterized protein n=1 Tax=Loa loa TaxID=7209 RepID=A0A1S0TRX0_LOALO|nr:hypothetical protein LOAG_09714 [Loa loa]EFO18779.1 hypothetical protein LOAG_09714 [Loa loa]